jgi:uridine kinase
MPTRIVAIYGCGGAGKSTLAQRGYAGWEALQHRRACILVPV